VRVAQLAGAEIFATAGNEEKRQFLRGLGIRHVMDSRSFDFVEQTLSLTQGWGVDVVLNALSGEFIHKSLSLLAPFGRFLEIGKRDIYENTPLGLYAFRKSLTFSVIDVLQMPPSTIRSLLQEVMQYFECGDLKPLPHRTFPISEVAGAFRYMRRANHIGKIIISLGS
jgi:NADPH:quinone reductase-like Zn-dependent oxidoreductase